MVQIGTGDGMTRRRNEGTTLWHPATSPSAHLLLLSPPNQEGFFMSAQCQSATMPVMLFFTVCTLLGSAMIWLAI
jgi:hypothetical protein